MNQELPEGPLTDANGKKWDFQPNPAGEYKPNTTLGFITPHIERKVYVTDILGNDIPEGITCFNYDKQKNEITEIEAPIGRFTNWGNETKYYSPVFKHRSDCQKWVNSNVKTLTREEALKMVLNALPYLSDAAQMVRKEIKETCLPTSTQK